jgi:hypothetical protein
MKGTITASTNPPPPLGSQPNGPALQALNIAKVQRGNFVKGFIDVSPAGAGGRLRVDLFVTRAALFGPGHPGRVRVGRLNRSSLLEGRVSFRVSLKDVARRALQVVGRLPLQAKVTVTPPQGEPLRRTRAVTLHV